MDLLQPRFLNEMVGMPDYGRQRVFIVVLWEIGESLSELVRSIYVKRLRKPGPVAIPIIGKIDVVAIAKVTTMEED